MRKREREKKRMCVYCAELQNFCLNSGREMKKLVASLHGQGFGEQLAWLATYIADEAKDREADGECVINEAMASILPVCVMVTRTHTHTPHIYVCGCFSDEWEEMCIVAVESKTAEALSTQDMQSVMLAIGLTPPSEQVADQASVLIPASSPPLPTFPRRCTGGFHRLLVQHNSWELLRLSLCLHRVRTTRDRKTSRRLCQTLTTSSKWKRKIHIVKGFLTVVLMKVCCDNGPVNMVVLFLAYSLSLFPFREQVRNCDTIQQAIV